MIPDLAALFGGDAQAGKTNSSAGLDQENVFRWATVTALSPLRIMLDSDTVALPFTPDCLINVAGLTVSQRVWVQINGKRVIILGGSQYAGGVLPPVTGSAYQATTTINSTSTTPVTLCSFTLPSAGTYDITYMARAQVAAVAGYGSAGIYDSSGTLVPNSEVFPWYYATAAVTAGSTATGRIFYTATGPETLTLRGKSAAAYTIGWVTSADGRTGVTWTQMAGAYQGPMGPRGPGGVGFPPNAFDVTDNINAFGTSPSFAHAADHPGFTIVTDAQTDGPITATYFVCETWLYQGPATWNTQFAWSPFGTSTGPDTRRWMRQMYGGSGNVWGPWEQIAGPVPWIAPTFTNSWVDYGSGFQTVGYRKVDGDRVELRGLMKNGTLAASAFTLPVGYRPTANILLTALTSAHASFSTGAATAGTAHTHPITTLNETACRVDINAAAGTVIIPVSGNNGWVSLDGLSFATT